MDSTQLLWQAQILNLQVQMEAMKAENEYRAMQGKSQAYGEEAFNGISNDLNAIIEHIRSYG